MVILAERVYSAEFVLSEAPGYRSREAGTIDVSQVLKAGSVLGQIALGAATVTSAVVGTNTGNGSIGTVTADAGAPAGDYKILIVEPAANAGAFAVMLPDGTLDGHGTVGVAYNGTINFTLADGATDFAAGDSINVNVTYAAGSGRWVAVNPSATDGSQVAGAILYDAVTTDGSTTAKATLLARAAEVNGALLDFGSLTTNQKTAAKAQLEALGIRIR